jgi:hypothetical protein
MAKAENTASTLTLVPASPVEVDWVGIYRRLKEVVEILRDYAVDPSAVYGWRFDEKAAARSLAASEFAELVL